MSDDTNIPSWWQVSLNLSRHLLATRSLRRQLLLYWLLFLSGVILVANWPLAPWLAKNPIFFLLTWSLIGIFTLFLLLFASYDMLATLREEKAKLRETQRQLDDEYARILNTKNTSHDEDDPFHT